MRGSSETRFAGLRPACRSEDRRSQPARHHRGRTFQAGGAIREGFALARDAGRRPALRGGGASSAPEHHAEAGATSSGWRRDVRGAERRGAGLETGVPSRGCEVGE